MDIRALNAARNYSAARPATEPSPNPAQPPAPDLIGTAQDFSAAMEATEATALSAMTGNADPHALVLALAQTELAVETAVTVRDKVVEAYQEILRMPV